MMALKKVHKQKRKKRYSVT